MTTHRGRPQELEPERYELHALSLELDRREFLKSSVAGLIVLCLLREAPAQEAGRGRRRGGGPPPPREIEAWLHIGEDGTVTASTGKVEVGQDIRTSLTQAVADELRLAPESVRLVMGDTARVPFDMGTFGSRTTPSMAPQLRRAAAAARRVLIGLAAERLGVDRAALDVRDGRVSHSMTDRSLSFGELTGGRKLVEIIAEDEELTPASDWKVAGRSLAKVDGRAFVTGTHRYTSDITRPGMLRGKVLRPAEFDAKLVSINASAAEALAGVTVVREGDFVGVTATDEPTATRALAAIKAEWTTKAHPSDRDLPDYFRENPAEAQRAGGPGSEGNGSVEEGLAGSDVKVEAAYSIAYIAHAPLEPRAAVAEWDGDRLTVWTGTQRPFGVRVELAQVFEMPEDQVRVIVPDTGSGYGGKHTGEAAIAAARLARAAGRPVKLVWTREEEFTWAYFRPGGLIDVKAGARKDGTLVAWEFHNYNSGGSGIETPYEVPNRRVQYHAARSPLRQGSYRALASTANHFARESVMDDLADQLEMDPLAFRLRNLKDDRLRAVLEAAAERFGWGRAASSPDRGFGLAGGTEKGGYVATCAEVAIDRAERRVRVSRLVTAFECGAIVNPDGLTNQIEGSLVMGLGGALFEAIRFAEGKIRNGRFSRYRVPRFEDMPAIEVVLMDRKDLPSAGAGESPIVAVAPAIGNAIRAATGLRIRSLPLVPNGLPT
jgi:isoquinoline 1-oxidoreductase